MFSEQKLGSYTVQRCRIPLDRLPWRVNDPLGRVKRPNHLTDLASKIFSNAHLFSSENEILSLCLQNTIRFPVYSADFRCIRNVSDVNVTAAIYFYPHWVSHSERGCKCTYFPPYVKMSKIFKNVRVSVLSLRASALFHSLNLQGKWLKQNLYTSAVYSIIFMG
jgi:hypothetical protein